MGGFPVIAAKPKRVSRRRAARVGDQDSDRPERTSDLRDELWQPLHVLGVRGKAPDLVARLGRDRRRRLLDPLERAACDGDARAFARERRGNRPAEPLARAHHERHPAFDTKVHRRNPTARGARGPATTMARLGGVAQLG